MKLNTAKKLTAGALALSMMFAMATPAFATTAAEDAPVPYITKNILLRMLVRLLRKKLLPLPRERRMLKMLA